MFTATLPLLLAYPALGGAFLLNPRSDQYKAGYAFREFAAEQLILAARAGKTSLGELTYMGRRALVHLQQRRAASGENSGGG